MAFQRHNVRHIAASHHAQPVVARVATFQYEELGIAEPAAPRTPIYPKAPLMPAQPEMSLLQSLVPFSQLRAQRVYKKALADWKDDNILWDRAVEHANRVYRSQVNLHEAEYYGWKLIKARHEKHQAAKKAEFELRPKYSLAGAARKTLSSNRGKSIQHSYLPLPQVSR
ncbi:MAG: hypothetical protein V7744_11620 [Pseudomonadales bacterium]